MESRVSTRDGLDSSFVVRPEEAVGLLLFGVLVTLSVAHRSPLFEPIRNSRLTFFTATGFLIFTLGWGAWQAWIYWSHPDRRQPRGGLRPLDVLRDWLPAVLCIGIYESMKHLHLNDVIFALGIRPKDDWMIWFDETVFGGHASVAIEAWISRPMTAYMRAVYYYGYYLYPFIVGLGLYLFRPRKAFRELVLAFLSAAFIGYTLYILVPVAGPRFSSIQHLYTIPLNPSGKLEMLQFDTLRYQYDCFPSLHTAIPLTVLVVALRHVRGLGLALAPFVLSTVLSTLYLRMHYAVDVLAGILLVPLCVFIGARGDEWWARLHGLLRRRAEARVRTRGAVVAQAGIAAIVFLWMLYLAL